jgi:D-glycero-D-manno-heptose 1,7-bisphosphate phosphatase
MQTQNTPLPRAVLLDRDGVINFDSPDYILTPEQWNPIPGSLEAIARLTEAGIVVAIVSNQSALGRGMIDQVTFDAIHAKLMLSIEEAGGFIAHSSYCPHKPNDGCDCRKPKSGMLFETLNMLALTADQALFIGDSIKDVEAAHTANMPVKLVQSGYGDAAMILEKSRKLVPSIQAYADLAAAVDDLLGNK